MQRLVTAFAVSSLAAFLSTSMTYAEPERARLSAATPSDVINAVNALRASYGFPAYNISSILMATAQNQADYMAATGHVSHTGAGGSSVTDRLLAAGYPLAGQLSLGGFRSENVTSGSEGMSAQAAVDQWTGDSVHLTTMISGDLTEIGAGVSVNGGRVYFVIDCALPTTDGQPQVAGTTVAGESTVAVGGGVISPVVVSTPDADGDLIHEVKAGQTLWQIAISYNTKIDEIKRLNHLFDDNIYPGSKLLIRQNVNVTATVSTETAMIAATSSPRIEPVSTRAIPLPTTTATSPGGRVSASTNTIMKIVIGIVAVAILGGGLVAWLGKVKK
jgi:uncharacterized protein YkwD/LysM repeat protein